MSSELKYNNINLAVNTQPPTKLLISFCLSHSCSSNAHKFILNDAVLTELFMIYYASRAPAIKTNHFWNHVFLIKFIYHSVRLVYAVLTQIISS
jgi:uncharacterized membrane protein YozB (DUF420 family)